MPASSRQRICAMLALAASCMLTLSGCFGGKNDRDAQTSLDEIYARATKSLENGNFRNAIAYYEALEARYPFSNQAKQTQLQLIYAYYRNGDDELAIDAAEQFERENPTHPRVDYALYMKGLAQFAGERNAFHKLFRVDLAKRPPVNAREAFSAFSQLLKRYPDSIYAPDARQRMIFLRNRLAKHEVHVAQYYMRRDAYAAALNRAKYVMETYDQAPAVADALETMVEAYQRLGMQDLAADTLTVLDTNYPDRAEKVEKKRKRFLFF